MEKSMTAKDAQSASSKAKCQRRIAFESRSRLEIYKKTPLYHRNGSSSLNCVYLYLNLSFPSAFCSIRMAVRASNKCSLEALAI